MNPKLKTTFALAGTLVVVVVVAVIMFRQEKEISRLHAVIDELTIFTTGQTSVVIVTNPMPANIEGLRREVAEVHRLRAEVTKLRREQTAATPPEARTNWRPVEAFAIFSDFNRPQRDNSLVVLQATSLAQSSPEEAARWVAALPPGEEQELATLTVVDYWTRTNAAAAAAWTTQFAEGPLRKDAMSMVARQWGLRDWNATADWLEKLPMGLSRDAAIGAFVMSADGYDIKLALEWANRMEAPESRTRRVEETARRWLREDDAAARAWLEKAQLPPGLAERVFSAN